MKIKNQKIKKIKIKVKIKVKILNEIQKIKNKSKNSK
jgi:hypothetical protein